MVRTTRRGATATSSPSIGNTDAGAQGFNDTIDPTLVDNGVGAQWDFPTVRTGLPAADRLDASGASSASRRSSSPRPRRTRTGQIATVTVTARNSDGNPDPGRAVRYAIAGANPGAGAVTTGADGTAAITWAGANVGTDTLTAFIDLNGNGVRDADEPQQTATVTWTAAAAAGARQVGGREGRSRDRCSSSTRRATAARGAPRPPKGFVPFKGAANIPVGSQLDTSKGRVALTSAADTGGAKTQTSDFYDGIFQVKQTRAEEEAQEAEGADHRPGDEGSDRAVAVRAVEGRARGGGVGQEEEEGPEVGARASCGAAARASSARAGKYSSATVRGTIWLVAGSLRGHVDQGHARDGPGARHQAQEDGDGQGRPQLPRARPARGEQEQARDGLRRCVGTASG